MNLNTPSGDFPASNLEPNKVNPTLEPRSPAKDPPPYSESLQHESDNTNSTMEAAEYLPPYSYASQRIFQYQPLREGSDGDLHLKYIIILITKAVNWAERQPEDSKDYQSRKEWFRDFANNVAIDVTQQCPVRLYLSTVLNDIACVLEVETDGYILWGDWLEKLRTWKQRQVTMPLTGI